MRFAVWNVRNLTDEDFNRVPDQKLLGYFRQDLLETRFLSKGRRIDLIQLWNWYDDQMSGVEPLLVNGNEVDTTNSAKRGGVWKAALSRDPQNFDLYNFDPFSQGFAKVV